MAFCRFFTILILLLANITVAWSYTLYDQSNFKSDIGSYLNAAGGYSLQKWSITDDNQASLREYLDFILLLHNELDINNYNVLQLDISVDYNHEIYQVEQENYQVVDQLYVGWKNYNYGTVLLGNIPSIYYNNSLASWLDIGLTGGDEILSTQGNTSRLLATKTATNSINYFYRKSNIRIGLQASGNYDPQDDLLMYDRNYGFGVTMNYAYGPMQFNLGWLRNNVSTNNTYKANADITGNIDIIYVGGMWNYADIYSALGMFAEHNAIDNFWSQSLSYTMKYTKSKKLVPQLIYGYKTIRYDNQQVVSDHYLYTSLIYYLTNYIDVYLDVRFDLNTNDPNVEDNLHQVISQYNQHDNNIMVGIQYKI